jgi:tetratricopeptide (TPR) repeat protein
MKSNSYRTCLYLLLVSLGPCAEAQFQSRTSATLDGEVETQRGGGEGLVVVLSSVGDMDRRADVSSGGSFEFFDIPAGQYQLTITTLQGAVLHSEYVSIHALTNRISLRLHEQEVQRPASGTVSAAKLRHKVPSTARKEFEKGMVAAHRNESAAAIGHLAKAADLDPGFMEAHNNLGIQHLKAQAIETAMGYFQKATELDPGAPEPYVNLALTLIRMEQYSEAETAARKAVRLAGDNALGRYYLGLALAQQQKNTSEALDNLQRACDRVPRARLAIAGLFEKRGDMERAKKELQAYLKAGNTEDRQSAESWLAGLQ